MRYFLIFFIFSSFCFSQTGIVKYRITPLKLKVKNKNLERATNTEIDLMNFTLKYNKTNSYFKKEKSIPKNPLQHKIAAILVGMNYNWFQNSLTKEAIVNAKVKNKMYSVLYDKMKFEDWVLSEETKMIDGYTCFKAERKQLNNRTGKYMLITAWCTPDIPVPYGPVGEGGLPGLILQVNVGSFLFIATEITLNPNKNKVLLPKEKEKISNKKYSQLLRNSRKVTID